MRLRLLSGRAAGFTLIELLVVILIIGILIAVSAPSFLGQTQKAHDSATQQNLSVAYKEAAAFAVDGNGAPGHVQGNYDGFNASVLHTAEPQLVAVDSGATSCPTIAVGAPDNKIFIDTAAGNNLIMCADPNGRVWTLTVAGGILLPFPAVPYTGSGSGPSIPPTVAVTPTDLTQYTDSSGEAFDPAWSADGNTVYFDIEPSGAPMSIVSVPLASPGAVPTPVVDQTSSGFGNFAPQIRSGVMTFGSDRGGVWQIWQDAAGSDGVIGASQLSSLGGGYNMGGHSLSYDGSQEAYVDGPGTLYLQPTAGGSALTVTAGVANPGISPDNSKIAVQSVAGSDSGNIVIYPAAAGSTGTTLVTGMAFGMDSSGQSPTYAPSGNKLVYGARDVSGENFVIVVDATSGALLKQYDLTAPLSGGCLPESFSFSADGSQLAFDDCATNGSENIYVIPFS